MTGLKAPYNINNNNELIFFYKHSKMIETHNNKKAKIEMTPFRLTNYKELEENKSKMNNNAINT